MNFGVLAVVPEAAPAVSLLAASWGFWGAGVVVGLVFQATLVAAVVWIVEVTLRRGFTRGLAAAFGLAGAQMALALGPLVLLFSLGQWGQVADRGLRVASVAWLLYGAWAVKRARPLATLAPDVPDRSTRGYALLSYQVARTMYGRIAAYGALVCCLNVHLRSPGPTAALIATVGLGLGSLFWWFYFATLAALFGHRVPEEVTLRSLRKLRLLAFSVFSGFALIGAIPFIVRFT